MGHINQIERLAKHRISERINDINNKILYPVLMGPHPIYTVEYSLKSNEKSKAIDLMKKLKSWINKNYIIKIDG